MSILITALLSIWSLVALLMILVILMQRPKSEGLGAAFGGGVTENIFGAQTTNVLVKFTSYLAAFFFVVTFVLSILYAHQNSRRSVLREELMKNRPRRGVGQPGTSRIGFATSFRSHGGCFARKRRDKSGDCCLSGELTQEAVTRLGLAGHADTLYSCHPEAGGARRRIPHLECVAHKKCNRMVKLVGFASRRLGPARVSTWRFHSRSVAGSFSVFALQDDIWGARVAL